MSDRSSIEWTDATWNPVRGCVKVSPGCKHCYAETFAERFRGVLGHPFEQGFDLRLVPVSVEDRRHGVPRASGVLAGRCEEWVLSIRDQCHSEFPEQERRVAVRGQTVVG